MRVFGTSQFNKEQRKQLSAVQQEHLDIFIERLKQGEQRGKRLRGNWLYEVKLQGKRAYYVLYQKTAVFVAVSDKKDQDEVITGITEQQEEYKQLILNNTPFSKVF